MCLTVRGILHPNDLGPGEPVSRGLCPIFIKYLFDLNLCFILLSNWASLDPSVNVIFLIWFCFSKSYFCVIHIVRALGLLLARSTNGV